MSQTLCKCEIALVCQWRVDKLRCIALVLVGIFKLSIHHSHNTLAILLHIISALRKVSESNELNAADNMPYDISTGNRNK